ncbi:MAG: AAA family ATPase [Vallitaleaceae bacterium]|jgi:DNA repair protein RecN (Recombination protein N)|nr:AAA family ATPase [Vallitaleaceae bacterium]
MLSYLHVKNIALIDDLEIGFKEGLNIITGETGAGKSILIGSINAVLGNNISKDFIKQGESDAYIELLFVDYNPMINVILDGLDIEIDSDLVISRKIGDRSVFRINGQIVNAKVIKLVAASMIDIHSQHEHQSLLDEKQHILLLDRFLSAEILEPLNTYKTIYHDIQKIDKEINVDNLNEEEQQREIEFLEYEINEVESLDIDIETDQDLEKNFKRYQLASETIKHLNVVNELFNGDDNQHGASHLVESAIKEMILIKSDDKALAYLDRLESISIQINELSIDLTLYGDNLSIDLEELTIMKDRLDQLNRIRMKYGPPLIDVLDNLTKKKA